METARVDILIYENKLGDENHLQKLVRYVGSFFGRRT
jgi:hypothetical protein